MLDYLSSKMVWIVAAILLTASMIGVYQWHRNSMEELALEERAEGFADIVNELSTVEGEFKGLVSYNESRRAEFYAPGTINGKTYTLNITNSGMYLLHEDRKVFREFNQGVHLFNPLFLTENVSNSVLHQMNDRSRYIKLRSGQDFFISSVPVSTGYEVFVYPDIDVEHREETEELRDSILEIKGWDVGDDMNETIEHTADCSFMIKKGYFFSEERDVHAPSDVSPVHLWKCDSKKLTSDHVERMDREHDSILLESGAGLTLERKVLSLDGNRTLMYFAYHSSRVPLTNVKSG